MKNFIFIISALLCMGAYSLQDQTSPDEISIDYLKTFAAAYGYAKYFHPSEEASNIDWNAFAIYGAEKISNCKNKSEVVTTLNQLFKPIGPGIVFSETKGDYDFGPITPARIEDYKTTYWQHNGVSTGMSNQGGVYNSVRVNQYSKIDESSSFGNLIEAVDPEKYRGKEIKYTGWVKLKEGSKGTGHLWLRVDKEDKSRGFFNNMGADPVTSTEWQQYTIYGEVDEIASKLVLGCFMNGKGTLYLDDIELSYKENDEWIVIPIENSDFEAELLEEEIENWYGGSAGYSYSLSEIENIKGKQCAVIAYEGKFKKIKGESLFEGNPKFGELIEKEIGDGIYCQLPLSLYGNEDGTYPKSNGLSELENNLDGVDNNPTSLAMRLGNVINTYCVFQHFYPYFDEVDVNWDMEFETALNRSYSDQTANDHLVTLQKLTATLRDGHVYVSGGSPGWSVPAISWEWIEDKLIVTKVTDLSLGVKVGDEVTQVNTLTAEEYFKEVKSKISAGTEGSMNHKAKSSSLLGLENSEISVEINNETIVLKRDQQYDYSAIDIEIQKNEYKELDGNIMYLNLGSIKMDSITALLPKLEQADGIICDLRGYPNGNHGIISHLLSEKDTSTAWMRVPQVIYPDQENLVGYQNHGWEMEPKEPYLGDKKVVFITDGRAISYAESFMSFIEGYKLATIVGQPTAGTNGNINPFVISGNFRVNWTGMKVVKHDGSQHHAIGILPNIYVDKTVEGVISGRDEFLEKAIAVIKK